MHAACALQLLLAPSALALTTFSTAPRSGVSARRAVLSRADVCMVGEEPRTELKAQFTAATLAALLAASPVTPMAYAKVPAADTLSTDAARAIIATKTKSTAASLASTPITCLSRLRFSDHTSIPCLSHSSSSAALTGLCAVRHL